MKPNRSSTSIDIQLAWLFVRWSLAQCARLIERSQFFAWAPPFALSLLGTRLRGTTWEPPIQLFIANFMATDSAHWITEQGLWLHVLIGSALAISFALIFIFNRVLNTLAKKSNDLLEHAAKTQEDLAQHFSSMASRACAQELEQSIAEPRNESGQRTRVRRL